MENTFKNSARWFASLSNGENAVEGVGKFEEIANELSPWQKLLSYVKENNLTITGMQIRIDGRTYTLPSINPKFGGNAPLSYKFGRKVAADMMSDNMSDIKLSEMHIFITAVYEEFECTVWVDEMGRRNSWVSIRKVV